MMFTRKATLAATLAAIMTLAPAAAGAVVLNILEQTMAGALKSLSEQARVQIIFSPDAVEGKRAPATVRDIGTEFWIRQKRAQMAVAVIEGAVEVSPKPGVAYTRMNAGESLAYDSGGQQLENAGAPLADLIAWRAGNIVFRDTPLTEVLAEFARYHNVNIEMDSRMADYRLSGRFASNDLDGLLKLVQSAYPVSVQRPASDRLRLQFRRS